MVYQSNLSQALRVATVTGAAAVIVAGCASGSWAPDDTDRTLLYSTADERPEWTMVPPEADEDQHYFHGQSARFATERTARRDAEMDGVSAATRQAGIAAVDEIEDHILAEASESETIDAEIVQESIRRQASQTVLEGVRPEEWHLEKWEGDEDDEAPYWSAHVLVSVPAEAMEKATAAAVEAAEKAAEDAETTVSGEGDGEAEVSASDPVIEERIEDAMR